MASQPDSAVASTKQVPPQTYKYVKPDKIKGVKAGILLCQSDLVSARMQVIEHGGENNLHFHVGVDTFWMVLKGRARFYGRDDEVFADVGPQEGLLTPRGLEYWFESVGDETLEILQVAGLEKGARHAKVDVGARKFAREDVDQLDGRTRT